MSPSQQQPAPHNKIKPWCYFIVLLLTACFRDEPGQTAPAQPAQGRETISAATELLTVIIPSLVSKDKLEITLPRCFFNISKDEENEIANHRVEMKAVSILYPLATFSDFPNNENNISQCPDFNQSLVGLKIGPLWPIKINGHSQLAYKNYWLKYNNSFWRFRIEEARNNQTLYTRGAGGKLNIFLNNSNENKEDLWVEFWPYKYNNGSLPIFESQIDIHSVLSKEFSISYIVYASPIFHDSNPPIKGAKFADDLLAIYKKNESLLDHPEILNGFISNNNRILDYLNQHIKIENPEKTTDKSREKKSA